MHVGVNVVEETTWLTAWCWLASLVIHDMTHDTHARFLPRALAGAFWKTVVRSLQSSNILFHFGCRGHIFSNGTYPLSTSFAHHDHSGGLLVHRHIEGFTYDQILIASQDHLQAPPFHYAPKDYLRDSWRS